jgi:hypothetical protein
MRVDGEGRHQRERLGDLVARVSVDLSNRGLAADVSHQETPVHARPTRRHLDDEVARGRVAGFDSPSRRARSNVGREGRVVATPSRRAVVDADRLLGAGVSPRRDERHERARSRSGREPPHAARIHTRSLVAEFVIVLPLPGMTARRSR